MVKDAMNSGPEDNGPDDPDAGPAPAPPGQAYEDSTVLCPWCGAQQELYLEPPTDRPEQEYFEECSTCGEDFRVAIDWLPDGSPRIGIDRGGENE